MNWSSWWKWWEAVWCKLPPILVSPLPLHPPSTNLLSATDQNQDNLIEKTNIKYSYLFNAGTVWIFGWHCQSLPKVTTRQKTLLKNAILEHSERLATLETCDQSDEETWPDQKNWICLELFLQLFRTFLWTFFQLVLTFFELFWTYFELFLKLFLNAHCSHGQSTGGRI